jgi:3-isopropylmalate/(R)-2-methylmalate dehydratase large subunit
MSKGTLLDKVWDLHTVKTLDDGRTQLFVGRHLIHEVTSPQAFEDVEERGLKVLHPELTFATLDHVIPTDCPQRPYKDSQAELMAKTLEDNVRKHGIRYFGSGNGQGVCHVVFPEQGVIWPGQVIVCGDSHTCTHGAFGTLAFGIGTTQVGHVLATQTLAMDKKPKVRRIDFAGELRKGVTAKDVALYKISQMGVNGGTGFAEEYGGTAVEMMNMEERMTLCNLAVEGGARSGYVNPDQITRDYILNRPFSPRGFALFNKMSNEWLKINSDSDAVYDDRVFFNVCNSQPFVTWGVNPEQGIPITDRMPTLDKYEGKAREEVEDAFRYMGLEPGKPIRGTPVDMVFIGSCTNGRISDLKQAARILKGRKVKVKTVIVSGSELVKKEAEERGYDRIFQEAGAEWRYAGCSYCLAMNPDKVGEKLRCASTSNRNFKKRQSGGLFNSRTHLMSPYTAAASAIEGAIADPRDYL